MCDSNQLEVLLLMALKDKDAHAQKVLNYALLLQVKNLVGDRKVNLWPCK